MLIKKDIINLRDAALNQAVRLQDKTTVIVRRYARSTKEKNNCSSCVFRERGIDATPLRVHVGLLRPQPPRP